MKRNLPEIHGGDNVVDDHMLAAISHPRRHLLQCRTPDEGGISLFRFARAWLYSNQALGRPAAISWLLGNPLVLLVIIIYSISTSLHTLKP